MALAQTNAGPVSPLNIISIIFSQEREAGNGFCDAGEDPIFINKEDCDFREAISLAKVSLTEALKLPYVVRYLFFIFIISFVYFKRKREQLENI